MRFFQGVLPKHAQFLPDVHALDMGGPSGTGGRHALGTRRRAAGATETVAAKQSLVSERLDFSFRLGVSVTGRELGIAGSVQCQRVA